MRCRLSRPVIVHCWQRARFGRFFYRFPNGEAGTDVFDRMATFITYLFRTMGAKGCESSGESRTHTDTTEDAPPPACARCKHCRLESPHPCVVADFQSHSGGRRVQKPTPVQNYVLVTHGLLMRIFCMCYLRWTVTEFEQVWNPSNCEIWVLQKREKGSYELTGRWRASPYRGKFVEIKFGKDKKEV